jgi:hypothetical protein
MTGRRMSALDQKQTFTAQTPIPAFDPEETGTPHRFRAIDILPPEKLHAIDWLRSISGRL